MRKLYKRGRGEYVSHKSFSKVAICAILLFFTAFTSFGQSITLNPTAEITTNSALISGSVTDIPDNSTAVVWYGTQEENMEAGPSGTVTNYEFSIELTGLQASTQYYYQVHITLDTEVVSDVVSFTTTCSPENMCEISYSLSDSYGDGWNGNAINVVDVATSEVLATWTINNGSSATGTLAVCNGREIRFEWVSGNYSYETSYQVYDATEGVVFSGSDAMSSTVTHTVLCPTCLNVKNISVTDITTESATITWSEQGSAQTWNIVVSTRELAQNALNVSGNIITATDSTYSLTGLSASTEYYVYVRAFCSDDDQSVWKSIIFKTRQIPASLPYTCGFEDAAENASWALSNGDQQNKWIIGTAAKNGGEKGLYISNDGGTSNSYNTSSRSYVYSFREINVSNSGLCQIEFDWLANGEGNYDNLKAYIIPDSLSPNLTAGESNGMSGNYNDAPEGWMDAGNMSSYSGYTDWQHSAKLINLEAGIYYLVFFWKNDGSSGSNPPAAIDNITIMTTTCPTIVNLAVTDITAESATISWSELGSAQAWNIVVSTTELEQDDLNVSENIITATDSTYSLTGLSASTEYYVYVRAFCSDDDQSVWKSIIFKTRQIPATLPYTYDFEDATENANWTLNNGNQTNKWHIGTAASNGGEKGLYISDNGGTSNSYNTSSTSYVYAYRELNIEEDGLYYISFDWRAYGERVYDNLKAFLIPNTLTPDLSAGESNGMSGYYNDAPSGWINAGSMSYYNNSSNWQNCSVEKGLEAGLYYLVFSWKNNGSEGSNPPAAIDNINIVQITCPTIANLAATNITDESASISWSERGSAQAWNIVVSTTELEQDVLNVSENIITVTDSTYSLTGLSPSTEYYVYVRAFCSDDDQSEWKSIILYTRHIPATLPYTYDFEDATENANWELVNGDQTNKWYIGAPTDSSSDVNTTEGGANGLYISNDEGVSNTYSGSETRVYAYRDILVPNGTSYLKLSFDWKAQGGSNRYEFLRVFWLNPDVVTVTAGSNPPTVDGRNYDADGQPGNYGSSGHEHWLSMQNTWQHEEMIISSDQFTDMGNGDKIYRLHFHWRNTTYSSQPPAAVDNIRLEQIIDPVVATSSASNIGGTSAILSGEILIRGASDIIERGFEYGTDPENLTENITSSDESNGFSADVIGLEPNTIYYYRAYAYNSDGSGYGEIQSFKTHKVLNGYTYIDLGLPSNTYWAYANVGATNSEDYGNYYAWGEIEPKDTYDWSTYQHCNGSENTLTKYCNNPEYGDNGFTDDLTILEASDDAANVSMGSFWRMPTHEEMEELYNNCTSTWTSINGVNGRLFTSRINGNSIFMPAAGAYGESGLRDVGSYGTYWPSSLKPDVPTNTWRFLFHSGNCLIDNNSRYEGQTVRAVYRPSPTVATNSTTDITLTSATLHGRILNIGSSEIIERGFVYGTSRSNLTDTIQSEDETNDFSVSITGLANGTIYYYRAYATNSDFTSYGEIKSFSTLSGQLGDHYYVNLGLPSGTMWASTNIGATTPEGYGDYFAWGETEPKAEYNWDTYTYANGATDEEHPLLTKYCNNSEYGDNGFTDNLTTLETMDDVAATNWGEEWRMPTRDEINELINNCTDEWTTHNGVNGHLFTGPNGNSIFVPATGYGNNDSIEEVGHGGGFWTKSLGDESPRDATIYYFETDAYSETYDIYRYYGLPVRAVYQVEPTVMNIDYEPYNCDFEDDTENGNWILNNGRQTNKWHIGSAVNNGGEKSLYISNDFGDSYSYNTGSISYVYAYRKINITEADKYQFDFDRRVRGEGNYDLLRAFLVPDSIHPNLSGGIDNGMSENDNPTPSGWIDISSAGIMSEQMGWKHNKTKLNIEPGMYYLTFFWKNDGSAGNPPPAAVDNVMVKRLPPFEVTTLVAPRTSTTATLGAEIVIDRETEITQVGFAYGESENQLLDTLRMAYSENTFTSQLTSLTPQTSYYYRAFAKYDDKTVFGDVVSFRTKSNDTDGIIDNPLTIDNAEEWRAFAEAMQQSENQSTSTYKGFEIYNCGDDIYFKLTADIDLADCDNTVVDKFSGHLNGDGNTVTIRLNEQLGAATAFNDLENAFVDSLNVLVPASFEVREDVAAYGALCLNAKSSAISNCTTEVASEDVKVMSRNSGKFGGIVGNLINSSVVNSTNNLPMELSASSYVWVGGIVGSMEGSYVLRCINNAALKGVYAGGIAGQILEATMPSSINIGDLFQNPFRDGQMLDAALISNLNAGNVTAQEMAGGMVASIGDGIVVVDKCMNIAEVFATNTGCSFVSIGGIVGYNPLAALTISNCANYGSFPALSMQMGGLFGNGLASMNKNISVPQFSGVSAEGNLFNCVYATVGTTEEDYLNPDLTETDDFFDEQVTDLRVDSLRLKYSSRGTGKPTTEMVGSALESSFSTNWTYAAGLYPMPAGVPEDDRTTLARIPIYFQPYNAAAAVMDDFTLPTSISGRGAVTWESSNPDVISISGGRAKVTRPGMGEPDVEVTLTATYEGATKSFVLLVISPRAVQANTYSSFIESDSVAMGGYFRSNTSGLSYLKEYGFLYSTKPNISDSTKVVSTNLSDEIHEEEFNGRYFSYATDGFEPGRSYYYTAFASTADTTTYGEVNRFRTAGPPEVIIRRPIYRGTDYMEILVDVEYDDEIEPEMYLYAGTDRDNLTMEYVISRESDYHYYYAYLDNLQPETKYWFSAIATDTYGTRRSDTVAFYTYGTFIDDRDDTEYKSIIIGKQIWMAENLRYEGDIPLEPLASPNAKSGIAPRRYYPSNDPSNVGTYGYLYNWPAAINDENSSKMNPSGVQGICPNGWHLPSDAEWKELNKELGCGIFDDAGAQMAGEDDLWWSGKLTNSYYFGTSGFNAVPAGIGYDGTYYAYDHQASFWSTTEGMENAVANYDIVYSGTSLEGAWSPENAGYSVRCLKGTTIYAAFDTVIMCADHYTYLDTTYTESGDYLRRFFYEEFADTAYSLHLDIDDCFRMASGVITDASTNTGIQNARVVIGNAVAWTNENGEYSLMAPKGDQPLWVSAVDYATYSENVYIYKDTAFNVELYSAQISIDAEDISITTYPYMAHYDSITISNVGTAPLVWSSVADYEGLELLPEPEGTRNSRNSRALWDSIQTFSTRFNAEQAVATDGFFIYTSSWQRPGEFNRYTPDGEYVETFFIENVGMIRNLSYDGTYFYGTDATNVILKLDLYNQTVVDSIVTDLNSIRHCSFNKQNGKLLAGDWNSLYSIDTATGVSTRIRNDLENIYGSAFDNLSPGGPYLWLFSQTSQDNGPSAYIRQFSLSEGDFTDKAHYLDDIEISDASLAGGICASAQILDGKYVLLANVQNPTGHNTIAAYEIGRINSMVTTDRKNGEIQPNESVTIVISEYVTETGTFNATVRYHLANVIGDQSDGLDISISAVVPECDAVQQLTATTDNYTKVTLNWQPVELDIYDSVTYLVFCDNSQYAIDTTTETTITIENLPVGAHCFNVRASLVGDYTCMTHPSETVCVDILEIPCNIPLVLEVKSEGEAITISWNSPVGADYYSLYKYSEPLDEHLTTTTFVDTDVVPESEYCYVLIAHFEDGVCSEISASECFRIVSGFCTEAPVLKAEAVGNTVALEWTECYGAVNYRIFRNDVFIGATNGTSYSDSPEHGGNHCYVVESDCEYGMFKLSNEECVFTDDIDEWSADELSIYPNPTDGEFYIEGQRIATVQIFNAIGQLVSEIENIEDERITINCESWTPGIYNVRIILADGETVTRKVTIFR